MRMHYGVQNFNTKGKQVEEAISHVQHLKQGIEYLANVKEEALLSSFGFPSLSSSDSDDSTSSEEDTDIAFSDVLQMDECNQIDREDRRSTSDLSTVLNSPEDIFREPEKLNDLLERSQFNWVALSEMIQEEIPGITNLTNILANVSSKLPALGLSRKQQHLIEQSQEVFKQMEEVNEEEDKIDDGLILSDEDDSFSQELVNWNEIKDPLSGKAKEIVIKRIKFMRRKHKRDLKKKIAEERILRRKRSKNVGKILKEHPNIGKHIEQFVEQSGVGADAWRRTGVLTFDGNRKVEKKVTFRCIKNHLEEKYGKKFSHGSIVQLCVARNKRRINAKNYKGVAKVTCRRSRKGFDLKFNPDSHWSAALYRGLNCIQYKEGGYHKMILNRDDLSVFRLDSMASSNKCAALCIKDKVSLATKTDYQQKYPCTLQTTSYNFTGTEDEGELCAGVVKGPLLHQKNPAQHAADLEMLQAHYEIKFCGKETGLPKEIECVRVDSGNDEAPCFEEVQFWWTKRHYERPTRVQLVTSRHSGGSNLNRVELQNGCEVKARSNLFIPSTLNGLNSDGSGKVDNSKLKQNLSDAIDVYISRVDGAPCADTNIRLYRGANSEDYQLLNGFVKTYLNGSKVQKKKLELDHPREYYQIKRIWDIRNLHISKSVPQRYIFHLVCCCKSACPHPLCQVGRPQNEILWYNGGPSIEYIPLPVPDPKRPFGAKNCLSCNGECAGHYLSAEEVIQLIKENRTFSEKRPPSEIIKSEFKCKGDQLLKEDTCRDLAKQVLIKPTEVSFWLEHLKSVQEHRAQGAKKAAELGSGKSLISRRKNTGMQRYDTVYVCFSLK